VDKEVTGSTFFVRNRTMVVSHSPCPLPKTRPKTGLKKSGGKNGIGLLSICFAKHIRHRFLVKSFVWCFEHPSQKKAKKTAIRQKNRGKTHI
jgi:hypothetical protein